MLSDTSGHHICAVKTDMLGLFSGIELLLGYSMCEIRLWDDFVEVIEEILVQLQDLTDVVVDRCTGLACDSRYRAQYRKVVLH